MLSLYSCLSHYSTVTTTLLCDYRTSLYFCLCPVCHPQVATFHNTLVPVDGMWIDMNEISNFCDGACEVRDKGEPLGGKGESPRGKGNFKFDPNKPPYAINNREQHSPLNSHTTDMDCVHYGGVLEYNAHNIYGESTPVGTAEGDVGCRGMGEMRQTCGGLRLCVLYPRPIFAYAYSIVSSSQ